VLGFFVIRDIGFRENSFQETGLMVYGKKDFGEMVFEEWDFGKTVFGRMDLGFWAITIIQILRDC